MTFAKALNKLMCLQNARWMERRSNPELKITIDESGAEPILKSSRTGKKWSPSNEDMLVADDWEVIRG